MSKNQPIAPMDVPAEVGGAIWTAARDAHAAAAVVFTATVRVSTVLGTAIKASPTEPSRVDRYSPDKLLAAIESLGWHLEHVDHTWVQTTTSTNAGFAGMSVAGVSGYVEAHYLFRRH